jgi:hypothetical protein
MLGREWEQRWLSAVLVDARDERARGSVIAGLPGTGKTTLLSYAAERAVAEGFRVVRLAGRRMGCGAAVHGPGRSRPSASLRPGGRAAGTGVAPA